MWNWTVPRPLLKVLQAEEERDGSKRDNTTTSNTAPLQRFTDQTLKSQTVYFDGTRFNRLLASIHDPTIWVVEGNDFSGGATRYNNMLTKELSRNQTMYNLRPEDADYLNFYHHVFHASFQPSSAVENLLKAYIEVDDTNNEVDGTNNKSDHDLDRPSLPMKLQPNRYMAAHYRAKFPGEPYRETWNVTILEKTALHAVECARSRAPSLSDIYVASDTALAIEAVHSVYSAQSETTRQSPRQDGNNWVNVWTYLDVQEYEGEKTKDHLAVDPPHLNFAQLEDPSGFYGIFVDLFLMSYSFCVVYGAGGFGRFGSLVSFQPWCGIPFTRQNGVLQDCPQHDEGK